jgi:hypothetical protein
MARVGLESNGSDGEVMLANTRYRFQTEWGPGTDQTKGYESESHFGTHYDSDMGFGAGVTVNY